MNQSQLEGSINRYSKKRKSYDIMKSSNGIKNGKKSLPQVFIDLNHPIKKGKLTIDERHNRLREQLNSNSEVSHFNDGKTTDKNKKIGKKESIVLKNLYNTQHLRNDENKNILNQYRDEIQLLKMDNQRLREENQKLKLNQQYNLRRIKEEKQQKHILSRQIQQLRFSNEKMEDRMHNYEEKIKSLFQQLIHEKKQRYGMKEDQKIQIGDQIVFTTLNSENNRGKTKGELGSYRQQNSRYGIYESQIEKFKRLTSPSSHSRGKCDKNKWYEDHKQYFKRQQQKGQTAYYKNQKFREASRNSTVYYQD